MKIIYPVVIALAALLSMESRAAVLWEYSGTVPGAPRSTKAAACQDAMADPEVAALVEEGFYIYPSPAGGTNYQCTVYNGAGEAQYHVGGLAINCTDPHVYSSVGGPHCREGGTPDPGEPDYPPGPPPSGGSGDGYCNTGRPGHLPPKVAIFMMNEDDPHRTYGFCSITSDEPQYVASCHTKGVNGWTSIITTPQRIRPYSEEPDPGRPLASYYFHRDGCTYIVPPGKCSNVMGNEILCSGKNMGGFFQFPGTVANDSSQIVTGIGPNQRDLPNAIKRAVQHPETGLIDAGTQVQAGNRATVEVPITMVADLFNDRNPPAEVALDYFDHVTGDWHNQSTNNYYHPGDYDSDDGSTTNYYTRDWGVTPFNPQKIWSNNDYTPASDNSALSRVNPSTGMVEPYNESEHTGAIKPPALVGIGTGGSGGGTTGGDTTTPMDIGGGPESYYERRYPDGIAGVLSARRAELEATPLFQLAGVSLPTGDGEYPAWEFQFVFFGGKVDLGTHEVAIPDWLWIMAQTFILIGAFVFAIRLVLGGA